MLVTALELTMADPRAQSDMIQRHRASLTAKVTVSRCRAATNASVAILASQSEPAARSACQMSISSALQMVVHNGGTEQNATAFGGACERCPSTWATFTRGQPDGEHAGKTWLPKPPREIGGSRSQVLFPGSLDRDCYKNASRQFVR
jgi:hypothetical protein